MDRVQKTFAYGDHQVTLATGEIARQATCSVIVTMGDTVVLATVVADKSVKKEPVGFFPLTVDFQARSYASGKVPGNYFRREGRPSEDEILISRLIDRTLRPLFPDGFENEVQIIVTLLSLDLAVSPDIPSLIAAAAAVTLSGIPFKGPVAVARVGIKDGIYMLNPNADQLKQSDLDLIVAGTESGVVMVESEAKELPENVMLGGVLYGHTQMQTVIEQIKEFIKEAGKPKWAWEPPIRHAYLETQVAELVETEVTQAYQIHDKLLRQEKLTEIFAKLAERLCGEGEDQFKKEAVHEVFHALEKKIVRNRILAGELRIDGRDTKTVRPITITPSILPRTHGSVLFTRGETQAIVVATLGTIRDAQSIEGVEGERKESFMLHYNFPPYCVGEIGRMTGTKRREIGHGRLAWRALHAVLPSSEEFPYVLRVVSEITESNGSSSMASVCGGCLALMDAGVPIKAPVAGVAMGLVHSGDRFIVLTDILGDEDHLGDMDFKVAGTSKGITALQMDIKIDGITSNVMEAALEQAKDNRLHILSIMDTVLSGPREKVSAYAPRIMTMKIDQDKIREVIGKGGATIRSITEEMGVTIDISDTGVITIAALDQNAGEQAMERIHSITADIEVGQVYSGKVTRLTDFGAFVAIAPGKEGLLHISQIANERVERVSDKVNEGETINVKVIEIDRQGRIRLSMKALLEPPVQQPDAQTSEQE